MNHCILIRYSNGAVGAIVDSDDPDKIALFSDLDAALDLAHTHPLLQALPYQIVCLDEL